MFSNSFVIILKKEKIYYTCVINVLKMCKQCNISLSIISLKMYKISFCVLVIKFRMFEIKVFVIKQGHAFFCKHTFKLFTAYFFLTEDKT